MSILPKPSARRPDHQREETMPLYDRHDLLPVIGSPISYKLSIRMMKRLITTTHGFLSFLFLRVGPLATANSFPGLL